ncbi:MAG: DUF86 domain-containing protein [Solimonas sp.]
MNDTAVSKITSLQHCVARACSVWQDAGNHFLTDFNMQDVAILNILRACELAIGIANMAIRKQQLGVPVDSRDSFSILQREGYLSEGLAKSLKAMVGFRNLAVHQYHDIDLTIVEHILQHTLDELLKFAQRMLPVIGDT